MNVAGAPSPIGFDLQPGEVLLYFRAHGTSQTQALGWMFGILLLPVLVGIVILWFVTRGGTRPGAYAVTSQRIVSIQPGNNWAQSYWLNGVVDLEPVRQNVHVQGGGLVGALVGAAVSAGLDALADRKQKLDPGYWQRATGITLTGASGQKQVVDLFAGGNAPIIGVTVAKLLAGQNQSLYPLDPSTFAGALAPSKPMVGTLQRIVAVVLFPAGCLFLGEAARTWGIYGRMDASDITQNLAIGVLFTSLGLALFTWGTLAARAANLAEVPVAPPAMSGAPPVPAPAPKAFKGGDLAWAASFGLVAVLFLFILGNQTASALTGESSYRSSRTPTGPAAPTAPGLAAPTTPGAVPPAGDLSFERIDGVLRQRGSTLTGPPDRSTMGAATTATFNTNAGPWIAFWDLTCPPRADAAVACFAGTKSAVSVEIPSDPSNLAQRSADARALALALATTPTVSSRALAAVMQQRGYRLDGAPPSDDGYTFAQRTYLFFAQKGDASVTVHVVDYTRAAAKQDGAVVRLVGPKVLLVSAEYGGGVTTAESLAAAIVGR